MCQQRTEVGYQNIEKVAWTGYTDFLPSWTVFLRRHFKMDRQLKKMKKDRIGLEQDDLRVLATLLMFALAALGIEEAYVETI